MSRNKDIEFYHNVSGLSYKECRANLKAAHWDLGVIFFPKLSAFAESCKAIVNIMSDCLDAVSDACKNMSSALREAVMNAYETDSRNPLL